MDGLLLIDSSSHATLMWLEDRTDIRQRLMDALDAWTEETDFALPRQAPSLP